MGTNLYPHMPILRVARALDESASAHGPRAGHSFDLGPLGEQSSQICVFLCFGRRWTAEKNLTPLADTPARFILGGKIRNRTYKQTNKQ